MNRFLFVLVISLLVSACSRPVPGVLAPNDPVQNDPEDESVVEIDGFLITPLADYELQARVLGTERYRFPSISPVDFALGWGEMSDPLVYEKLNISQGGRWYYYRWKGEAPVPQSTMITQSANVHMIPKNDDIRDTLLDVDEGDIVFLKGHLVRVSEPKLKFSWVSSLTRSDQGDGACELMLVDEITIIVD